MGMWDGIEKAQVYERGTFLEEGGYVLKIKRCLDKTTRKSGQAFIAECEVMASNNPKHPVGQTVTWFQKMADREVAFGAIKAFVAAVYEFDMNNKQHRDVFDAQVNPGLSKILDAATNDAQNFLKDRLVACEVVKVTTTKGLPFSRHTFSPAPKAA